MKSLFQKFICFTSFFILLCLSISGCSNATGTNKPESTNPNNGGQDKFSFVGTWKSDNFNVSGYDLFYIINAFENYYDCFIFEASTYALYKGWKGTYSQSVTGSNTTIIGKDKVYYSYINPYWKEVEIPENATFEVLSNTQVVNKNWERKDVIFTKQTATSSGSAELAGPFLSVDGYARVEPADNGLKITVNNRYNWGNLGIYVRNVNSDYPRESQIYQVLDFKPYSGGNNTEEILFPFVEAGNTYEVVVFMQKSDWSGWFESKPVLVKATGGKGEEYAKMTSGFYNPTDKQFSFEIDNSEKLSNIFDDTNYESSIIVGVYSYAKDNVWEHYEGEKKESHGARRVSPDYIYGSKIDHKYKNIFLDISYKITNKNDHSTYNIKLDPNNKYATFSIE